MRAREKVIFDIQTEKFKYLHGEENKVKNKVDIDVLNKRLNRVKRLNFLGEYFCTLWGNKSHISLYFP